jgi:hypothetical protein
MTTREARRLICIGGSPLDPGARKPHSGDRPQCSGDRHRLERISSRMNTSSLGSRSYSFTNSSSCESSSCLPGVAINRHQLVELLTREVFHPTPVQVLVARHPADRTLDTDRAAVRPLPGVQSWPVQSTRCAGGASVMPSHHTSPSSVIATLVKMVLARIEAIAFGLDCTFVPGATPKKPDSGLIA